MPLYGGTASSHPTLLQVLRITIPGSPIYTVTAPETIRLNIPALAISTRLDSPVIGYAVINATAGTARLGGNFVTLNSEGYFRDSGGGNYVDIVLQDDFWDEHILDGQLMRAEARVDFYSEASEPTGWNQIGRREIAISTATLLNSTALRLVIPSIPNYDITSPEVLALQIPAGAVRSRQVINAASAARIRAGGGSARLGGTLVFTTLLGEFVNVSDAFVVRLEILDTRSHEWHPDLLTDTSHGTAALDALATAQPDLINATRMGSSPLANFTLVTAFANWTLEFTVAVARDFESNTVDANFTVGGGAFIGNTSALVRISSTWLRHLEEVHTRR